MKNYYEAKISVSMCMVDIRINDVSLLRRNVDSEVTALLPVNHLIESSGAQKLSISVFPCLGEFQINPQADCSVDIWRYDGTGVKMIPVESVCQASLQMTPKGYKLPLTTTQKVFMADVAYKIDRWSACHALEHGRNMSRMVADYFLKIGRILSNGHFSEYAELVQQRESAVCTALDLGRERIPMRNKMLFDHLTNGFVYTPLAGKKLIEYYADNRLVTILDEDMQSALRFENIETGEILALDLLLGVRKGDRHLSII